jgi:ABC-type multidrug transport system fused ATPase/permease subunit
VIIAHRLSTIRRADRIMVMADGRIVEEGDHEQLMATEGLYHHLQALQNGFTASKEKIG